MRCLTCVDARTHGCRTFLREQQRQVNVNASLHVLGSWRNRWSSFFGPYLGKQIWIIDKLQDAFLSHFSLSFFSNNKEIDSIKSICVFVVTTKGARAKHGAGANTVVYVFSFE